jgi:hypothetical protein
MHQASRSSLSLPGHLLPIELRHVALAGYLCDVSERAALASRQPAYPVRIVAAGDDMEGR